MKKIFILTTGMMFAFGIGAQADTVLCDFESEDSYTAIGVYDTWDDSPFRTGELAGNVAVVTNHLNEVDTSLGYAPNESEKILAVQRSRFGSNTFGALVSLATTFELENSEQYVHVKMYTPVAGTVMLVGLGNRDDRPWQSEYTEQFAVQGNSSVTANEWNDCVFTVTGATGITIRHLVVVVDNSSPHNRTSDFAAYIDDIILSYKSASNISSTYYPINYDESQEHTRGEERYTDAIVFDSDSAGEQTLEVNQLDEDLLYIKKLDDVFLAMPGDSVTASFECGAMNAMAGYIYLDMGNDGSFDVEYDDESVTDMLDLMSYSQYNGVDSDGNVLSGSPDVNPPSFQIPEDLEAGYYRIRYKIDWNCVDPGGNTASSNTITANGGIIVDTRVCVHEDYVTVSRGTDENGSGGLNGDILFADGTEVNGNKVPFGEAFQITTEPAPGFTFSYVVMRHGYNLDGDSVVCQNRQWQERIIYARAFEDDVYTIEAEYVDGNVLFIPYFSSISDETTELEEYGLNFDTDLEMSDPSNNVLTSFKVRCASDATTTFKVTNSSQTTVYRDLMPKEVKGVPGDLVKTVITYSGSEVHSYFYLDMNRDGIFTVDLDDTGVPTYKSDLLAYSYYEGYNSDGEVVTSTGAGYTLPTFYIPDDLPVGIYRGRLKLDVNNVDPGGNWSEDGGSGMIDENGGIIVDFLVNLHGDEVDLEVSSDLGFVVGKSYSGIPETIPFGTAYSIQTIAPDDGYDLESLVIRHGYKLDGDQYVHGNRMWNEYEVTTAKAGRNYSIAADSINGNLRVNAVFSTDDTQEYNLKFADEFDTEDGTLPDDTFWSTPVRYSSTWNRFIAQTDEGEAATAYIEDGKLVLKAIPNEIEDEGDVDMITGAIRSLNKMNFTYGKVVARVKTTPYSGNFPAFWLLPEDSSAGWPTSGEIDIWEQIDEKDIAYHTIHSYWANTLGNSSSPTKSGTTSCTTGEYHVFLLLWEEDCLTWYVNGSKSFTYAKSEDEDELDQGQWPFDAPFYIILNQSVGDGSWAAEADVSHTYETLVDYVRVYQKDEQEITETGIENAMEVAESRLDFYTSHCTLRLVAPQAVNVKLYDLSGRLVFDETVQGNKNVTVPTGVYILNGQKVLVP